MIDNLPRCNDGKKLGVKPYQTINLYIYIYIYIMIDKNQVQSRYVDE